jgi:hypothetical protein
LVQFIDFVDAISDASRVVRQRLQPAPSSQAGQVLFVFGIKPEQQLM